MLDFKNTSIFFERSRERSKVTVCERSRERSKNILVIFRSSNVIMLLLFSHLLIHGAYVHFHYLLLAHFFSFPQIKQINALKPFFHNA
jgi:hypothetical protein